MEHQVLAFQCSACKNEFVIVNLSKKQRTRQDGVPYCPCCADDADVAVIDCIDLRLVEHVQLYELRKNMKPLPE
jgi:hypothetical protein